MSRSPLALLVAVLCACGGETGPGPRDDAPLIAFDRAAVRVAGTADTLDVRVEVAATPDQRSVGLMERSDLPEDAGMIFVFPADQPPEAGFWMFNTRVPLDIAYLDADGAIVAVRSMEPCASPAPQYCDRYPPGVPYRATLEVNRGYFESHGIGLGDRVLVPAEVMAAAR